MVGSTTWGLIKNLFVFMSWYLGTIWDGYNANGSNRKWRHQSDPESWCCQFNGEQFMNIWIFSVHYTLSQWNWNIPLVAHWRFCLHPQVKTKKLKERIRGFHWFLWCYCFWQSISMDSTFPLLPAPFRTLDDDKFFNLQEKRWHTTYSSVCSRCYFLNDSRSP